jgi:hypothetical protein
MSIFWDWFVEFTDWIKEPTVSDETATKAARWWANQLRSAPSVDNGDPDTRLFATLALANIKPLSEEEISKFEACLKAVILEKQPDYIGCDYEPCQILRMAAKAANISIRMAFSFKTYMYISKDGIKIQSISNRNFEYL